MCSGPTEEKASFDALRRVIADVSSRNVDCTRLPGSQAARGAPAGDSLVDRIEWSPTTTFSAFNEIWRFAIDVRADATFRATVYRVGTGAAAARPKKALLEVAGALTHEHPRVLQFPAARLRPGLYRIAVEITRRDRPRLVVKRTSPDFLVK